MNWKINLVRIVRSSLIFFALITAAQLLASAALHSELQFDCSLSIVCPVLLALLVFLAERNARKRKRPRD